MESTAHTGDRSVGMEPYMRFAVAQRLEPCSAGRKHDFKDATAGARLIANELILSFVPDGEQRTWRSMTRMRCS